MVRIRLPDMTEAVLETGRWACDDARFERLLNAMRAPWEIPQADAQVELSEARVVSKVLGAEIIEAWN